MKNLEEFVDALGNEARLEMAENFFGNRRQAEEETELLRRNAEQLRRRFASHVSYVNLLHALLLDVPPHRSASAVKNFYQDVPRVDPTLFIEVAKPEQARLFISRPFALTRRGRYVRLVMNAYSGMQNSIDAYLHGRWENDPNIRGKKRQTINIDLLAAWVQSLNERIRKVNQDHSPSSVLEFNRRMNPAAMDRERIAGGTLDNYSQAADKSLAIPELPWDELKLPRPPDLPHPDEIGARLRLFALALYREHSDACKDVMRNLYATRP